MLFCFWLLGVVGVGSVLAASDRPNILWIYVDDMSDWLGCYGHELAETPNIDRLAEEGIRFSRAYMPSPVCSSTRSALIMGTMQTSLGLHQHRTMSKKPLPDGIQTVPEYFREAGYLTFNEQKEDYNFRRDRDMMYSPEFKRPTMRSHLAGTDLRWMEQLKGKRWFGQIQLKGGKIGGETGSSFPAKSRVDPARVDVPPYYPDTPIVRNAIARHYEQIAETDEQVGAIMQALDTYGFAENTVTFFFTDHGSPLLRSKQFLYEEGTKVPLVIHGLSGVSGVEAGVRDDLVNGIDIATTAMGLAGINLPNWMEGRDLLAPEFEGRDHVIMARDRCGIAVDRIRAVRTEHFRYIRNYQTDRALYQPQYRERYALYRHLKNLYMAGELSPLQASYWQAEDRPAEELYDLRDDPHQLRNLAGKAPYVGTLERHRTILREWEKATKDQGQLPEDSTCLELVFKGAKGKVAAPEFDFLKTKALKK